MLKQRVVTAGVLLALFLGTLLLAKPQVFCVLSGLITLWGAWEWTRLMGLHYFPARVVYVALNFVLMGWLFYVPLPINICINSFYVVFFFWVATIPLIALYPRAMFWKKSFFIQGLIGLFVLIPCWFAINFIRDVDIHGQYLVLFLFVLVWTADITAYFVGRRFGKKSLAPRVSPGKTREGVYCGLFAAMAITFIPLIWFQVPYHFWAFTLTLALVTAFFSVVGDLFESLFKRSEGLKDSGSLLPGHGGLLDRIDGLTAAAPVFTAGAIILSKITS